MTERPANADSDAPADPTGLGRWLVADPLPVTTAGLDAYADAVGAGALPLYTVVAGYPVLFAAVDAVLPPAARGRVVHGEHEVTVHRPVHPGDLLHARGRAVAIVPTRAGAAVHVELAVTAGGTPVATHRLTALARGVTATATVGDPVGEQPRPVPEDVAVRTVPVAVPADLGPRYAAATGDRNAVHLDPEAARAAGFPGVIVHGLGILGLVTAAIVRVAATDDPARLYRIGARFAAPVVPGCVLRLRLRAAADRVGFEVVADDGRAVLRTGWATWR
jgi:acyl dehydratase